MKTGPTRSQSSKDKMFVAQRTFRRNLRYKPRAIARPLSWLRAYGLLLIPSLVS